MSTFTADDLSWEPIGTATPVAAFVYCDDPVQPSYRKELHAIYHDTATDEQVWSYRRPGLFRKHRRTRSMRGK